MSLSLDTMNRLLQVDSANVRQRLREILVEKSLKVAKEGENFVLSSGQTSTVYFDGKKTTTSPEGLYCVARLILDEISNLEIEAIGGPTLGADPIVAGVSLLSYFTGNPLPCFIVRKETKGHGVRSRVEGASIEGKRVVIVEDVITTGGAVLGAIQAVRDAGAEIVRVIALIDREQGAAEIFNKGGMEFHPIFTLSELLS